MVLGIILFIILAIAGVAVFAVKDYMVKNSWAEFEIINEDGTVMTDHTSSPNKIVAEYNGIRAYGRGETVDLERASFRVDDVKYGGDQFAVISSYDELILDGKKSHKLRLHEGDSCIISSGEYNVTIRLKRIIYQ